MVRAFTHGYATLVSHSTEHEQKEDVVSLAVRGKRLFEKREEPSPVRILSVFLLNTERLLAVRANSHLPGFT